MAVIVEGFAVAWVRVRLVAVEHWALGLWLFSGLQGDGGKFRRGKWRHVRQVAKSL